MSAELALYKRIALEIAAELTEHPDRWTQGSLYRDSAGKPSVEVSEQEAVCWCLMGHINKRLTGSASNFTDSHGARDQFRKYLGQPSLANFNDSRRTVQQIIDACKRVASSGTRP